MRKQGTVVRWDEARGFGFIRSAASTAEVFFHVRDYRDAAGSRPREGQPVSFEEIHVGGKGPRAMAVQAGNPGPADATRRTLAASAASARDRDRSRPGEQRPASGAWLAVPLMLVYALVVVWAVWQRHLPSWVLVALPLLNLGAFMAYWLDKYAAANGHWRTSENTLHLWSLAGGWGGAWLAQQLLRHKSRKASFQQGHWACAIVHCGLLLAWLWSTMPR